MILVFIYEQCDGARSVCVLLNAYRVANSVSGQSRLEITQLSRAAANHESDSSSTLMGCLKQCSST